MPALLPLLAILSPTGQRGWLSTALLAAVIAIPYLNGVIIRGRRLAGNSPAPSPLLPLWPHCWLALLPRQRFVMACLASAACGSHLAKPHQWPLAGHNCPGSTSHPTGRGCRLALREPSPLRPRPPHPFRPDGGHRAPPGPHLAKQPLPLFPVVTPGRRQWGCPRFDFLPGSWGRSNSLSLHSSRSIEISPASSFI
jgi:hypothetical protein